MITRTLTTTTFYFTVVDIENQVFFEDSILLEGDPTPTEAMKVYNEEQKDAGNMAVKFLRDERISKRYGISLDDFIAHAVELPLLKDIKDDVNR